ncbi:hypothetical protein [Limnoglobus roseus]|uniref:Uncharacterized protein n=1 Tax=Limnoglobus roseus TaxID=2598579 RepID=A0A5C1AKE9_9BACT|nr:hypothetical protein [Limnoglobus roseus]QEL17634.1 hypothetical protein PX52LOC_04632 [Limnoglobus roseus]
MTKFVSKADLSPARGRLVELFQELNFGRIHFLHILGGEPVLLDPPPRVVREIKLGGDNTCRRERALGHFLLKAQLVELFDLFDRIGDGVVELIEIKNGLPFRMLIPELVS